MIYGRFGNPVTIQRLATIEDVQKLDGRKPDKKDRDALASDSYVVVSDNKTGKLRLYHQAFLKADAGSVEISTVVSACKKNGGLAP